MAQNEISIVVTAKDVATKQLKAMGRAMEGLKASVFSLQGAIAGVGVGAVAQGLVNTASSFENLELSLTTITGSSAKARDAMSWISEFTATTPYELEEVANAFKKLASYGLEPTKYLKTLGDTAAAMGKSLNDAVEMFADATTGEFERLKEFGMRAKTEGDKVTFSWMQNGQQMTKVVDKTGEALSNFLGDTFQQRFGGGMDLLSKGWAGMWSNLKDQVTLFAKAVMDSGVFDYMKDRLAELLSTLTSMTQDGSLKELAQDIGGKLVTALQTLTSSIKGLISLWSSMPDGTSGAVGMGILGNMLFGAKGAAVIGGGTYLIQSLAQSVEGFKRSMSGDISFWDYMWANRQELEAQLDQADAERLAKEQAKITQMEALDAQRTANLKAQYSGYAAQQAAVEAETAAKIKTIQTDVAEFRKIKWDEITKNIKAKLKEAETEEKKYSDQVKKMQEERAQASLSTQEKVRALLRTQMSDYNAYRDRVNEANESLQRAQSALRTGDGVAAETWAKKAQEQFAELNTEIKDGERTLVAAATANAIAVTGVLDAGKALEQALLTQEQAAENNRKKFAEQADQAKADLASIKEMQDAVSSLEMSLTANDNATPVLERIQSEMAQIKDKTVTVTVRYRKVGDDGLAHGGRVPGFAFGGKLPGYSLRDNLLGMIRGGMPIGLAGGEFVTNAYSTRLISRIMPGLMESLNRVRSAGDLSKLLGIPGRAAGGPVGAYRFTFATAGQEATISTNNRAEADGLLALARALNKQKLVRG